MEKRLEYSFITTILNSVFGAGVLFTLLSKIFALLGLGKVLEISGKTITEAGKHDLTGGYEVLGGLAIGILGALGTVALTVIIIASIVVLLMLISTIIVGLVLRSNYKNGKPVDFTADSIVKIIIDGLIAVVCISFISIRQPFWILIAIVPTAVVVLCIISLCTKIEKRD